MSDSDAEVPDARLNEFTKEEWRDVMKATRPDLSDEDFEAAWAEFQEMKRRKSAQ